MPSPVGHALGAIAAGWIGAGAQAGRRALVLQIAILAALGVAPDLDLLIGRHSRETHSVGAAVIVGLLAAWQRWPIGSTRLRIFLAAALAWATHPFLDSLAFDSTPPHGVMAWWPFSREHTQTGLSVFAPIYRSPNLETVVHNSMAVVREVAVIGPVVLFVGLRVWFARRRARGSSQGRR